ncbi:MAG: twin-arginine translocase TatA/TatE family subunit [Lentisphaerota bacterium]
MFMPGAQEWFLIIIVVLLLFGAKRIPEIARALGKATKEFRKAKDDVTDEIAKEDEKKLTKDQDAEKNKK